MNKLRERKTVSVNLRYDAVTVLKRILPTPWSEDLAQMYRVGEFLEGDINETATDEPQLHIEGLDGKQPTAEQAEQIKQHNAAYEEWAKTTATLGIPAKTFSDIAACVKHFAKKKALSPTKAVLNIIKEFELNKES